MHRTKAFLKNTLINLFAPNLIALLARHHLPGVANPNILALKVQIR
jgi:hypothetical protein